MHKSPEWLFVEPGSNQCSGGKILYPRRLRHDWCEYVLGACVCLSLSAGTSGVDFSMRHCHFSRHLFSCLIPSQPVRGLFSSCSVGFGKCRRRLFFIINCCVTNIDSDFWWLSTDDAIHLFYFNRVMCNHIFTHFKEASSALTCWYLFCLHVVLNH